MSDLRQAAQQALDEMLRVNSAGIFEGELNEAITALRAALLADVTPAQMEHADALRRENEWLKDDLHDAARLAISEYERGFVDGMNLQTKRSVDKAVNRMAEPEQEPVAWADDVGAVIPHSHKLFVPGLCKNYTRPLYTAPTPRKPLTDEEIERACVPLGAAMLSFTEVARAIERAHGIGEQDGS